MRKMKKLWWLLCMGLIVTGAKTDDTRAFKFKAMVSDKESGMLLNNYIVEVYEGNEAVQFPEVSKKGEFECQLFADSKYTIDISLEGFYPKRIVVHTNVPGSIKKLPTFKFEVELIHTSEYDFLTDDDPFATSIFDFPYVVFEWDEEYQDFNYRKEYTKHIKEKYKEVEELL